MGLDYSANARQTALREAGQAVPVRDCESLTAPARSKDGPTKAEFDKVVNDLQETQATVNELLAALRKAGIMEV